MIPPVDRRPYNGRVMTDTIFNTPAGPSRKQRPVRRGVVPAIALSLAVVSLVTTALIGLRLAGGRGGPADGGGELLAGGPIQPVGVSDSTGLIQLPAFDLTERSGVVFGTDQLHGKVWVANFIFTRCSGPCPAMTSHMAQLHDRLRQHPDWPRIRLVTFSVDPQHDTPDVLTEYARWAKADPARWLFLTGTRDQVWQLIRNGFKLPIGEDTAGATGPIFHSQKFVLVDGDSQVRGFYDVLEEGQLDALQADLHALVRASIDGVEAAPPTQAGSP